MLKTLNQRKKKQPETLKENYQKLRALQNSKFKQ